MHFNYPHSQRKKNLSAQSVQSPILKVLSVFSLLNSDDLKHQVLGFTNSYLGKMANLQDAFSDKHLPLFSGWKPLSHGNQPVCLPRYNRTLLQDIQSHGPWSFQAAWEANAAGSLQVVLSGQSDLMACGAVADVQAQSQAPKGRHSACSADQLCDFGWLSSQVVFYYGDNVA